MCLEEIGLDEDVKLFRFERQEQRDDTDEPVYSLVEEFLLTKAPTSQGRYRYIWGCFLRWKGFNPETVTTGELRGITRRDGVGYLNHLQQKETGLATRIDSKKLAKSTIKQYLCVLRAILRHLRECRAIDDDPIPKTLVKARVGEVRDKRPTEMIPFMKVKEIIHRHDLTTAKGRRNQVAMALLFGTGIRLSELHRIKLEDLKVDEDGIYYLCDLQVKGRTTRDVVLPEWTAQIVADYVEERIRSGCDSAEPLFVRYTGRFQDESTGQGISQRTISRIFKATVRRVGLDPTRYSCHSARATAITRLLAEGVDHRAVQEFSGHKSIQMVERYDKRRTAHKRAPALNLSYDKEEKKNE